MNTLIELQNSFRSGKISKADFIDEMYSHHASLFDYLELLKNGQVREISLSGNGVVFHLLDPDIKMISPEGDARMVPVEAFNFGSYERREWHVIRAIMESMGGKNAKFLDIGANAGFYALGLSSVFPGVCGWAFEPLPHVFQLLKKNFELNKIENVKALNFGLSNEEGSFTFYSYPSQSAASSMTRNLEGVDAIECECKVKVLDSLVQSTEGLDADFIKCDVEGAEKLVFEGGEQFLKNRKPVIFTEMLRKWSANYHYHPNDMMAYLKGLGYDCLAIGEKGVYPIEKVDEKTMETNYVFWNGQVHPNFEETLRSL